MTSVTLTALANGHINANAATTVTAYNTSYFATGYFGTPQTNRGLLIFDITSIPVDATINSATLTMTVSANFLGTSHTINLYRLKRKFYGGGAGESATYRTLDLASWNNYRQTLGHAWSTAGAGDTTNDRDAAAIGSVAVTSATTSVSITLNASLVQEWISGAMVNNGLILIADNEINTTLIRWNSIANATPSNRPRLTIDYTPVSRTLLDDLVSYWSLDDVLTDAKGGNTLTNNNAATFVAGVINNGSHLVEASSQWLSSSAANLKPSNSDWTWAGWVKLTDNTDYRCIVAQRGTDDQGWMLFYHKVSVLDYFVLQINDDGSMNGDKVVCDTIGFTGGHPATGTWIFVACRHDSVRHFGELFINGNAPDSGGSHSSAGAGEEYAACNYYSPYPGSPVASSDDYMIGRRNNAADYYYHNGDIDEVGFWSRWLSNDEISALYNSGAGLSYPFGLTPPVTSTSDGVFGRVFRPTFVGGFG